MRKNKYFKFTEDAGTKLEKLHKQTSINQTKLLEKAIDIIWSNPQALYDTFPGDTSNLSASVQKIITKTKGEKKK